MPAWISNYIRRKVWGEIIYPFLGEIIYPFLNFNGCTVEVEEWISYFIPHFIMDLITYPCWDYSLAILAKGATAQHRDSGSTVSVYITSRSRHMSGLKSLGTCVFVYQLANVNNRKQQKCLALLGNPPLIDEFPCNMSEMKKNVSLPWCYSYNVTALKNSICCDRLQIACKSTCAIRSK